MLASSAGAVSNSLTLSASRALLSLSIALEISIAPLIFCAMMLFRKPNVNKVIIFKVIYRFFCISANVGLLWFCKKELLYDLLIAVGSTSDRASFEAEDYDHYIEKHIIRRRRRGSVG